MVDTTNIQFEYEADVLVVRLAGRYMLDQMEEAIIRIAEAIEARPIKATLVDFREVTGAITFMDRFKLGKLAGQYLRRVPIGALTMETQLDRDRIAKVVATNRGATVEVFTDFSAAKAWLAGIPSVGRASTSR